MTVVQAAVPLVRLHLRDLTVTPEPGRYYQDGERLLLCISVRRSPISGEHYWFVDADEPLVIKSAGDLAAAPLRAVDLIPAGVQQ